MTTFDTTSVLAGMYLWLLFGFFSSLLGCDLQRLVSQNMYVKHFLAFVCFFFLITILDAGNKAGVLHIWFKSLLVYVLFVMSTRSKVWASLTAVGLLILDQTLKMHLGYLQAQESTDSSPDSNTSRNIKILETSRDVIFVLLVFVIIAGFVHYYFYQKADKGSKFDTRLFLLGVTECQQKLSGKNEAVNDSEAA
jgi:hypothetical protein